MIKIFLTIIIRDLQLAARQGSTTLSVAVFFVLSVTLFPLSLGVESSLLSKISPGIIWVAALLSSVLSLDRIFQTDFEDGSLDLLVLTDLPLEVLALAKATAHWIITGLLLVVLSPLLGILIHLKPEGYLPLLLSMLVGTPILSLLGMIGASLTVSIRRGGVLLSLLVIPLYIPVLIFGVDTVQSAIKGTEIQPQLMLLTALLLFSLVLGPIAAAAALRINIE